MSAAPPVRGRPSGASTPLGARADPSLPAPRPGEPIGLKRLDARPIATLSLEAQERHERREKVFRED